MTLPDITHVQDQAAVPALLAPFVAEHGPLFVFCEDVTGHLLISKSPDSREGAEMLYKIGPKGSFGATPTGARVYSGSAGISSQ